MLRPARFENQHNLKHGSVATTTSTSMTFGWQNQRCAGQGGASADLGEHGDSIGALTAGVYEVARESLEKGSPHSPGRKQKAVVTGLPLRRPVSRVGEQERLQKEYPEFSKFSREVFAVVASAAAAILKHEGKFDEQKRLAGPYSFPFGKDGLFSNGKILFYPDGSNGMVAHNDNNNTIGSYCVCYTFHVGNVTGGSLWLRVGNAWQEHTTGLLLGDFRQSHLVESVSGGGMRISVLLWLNSQVTEAALCYESEKNNKLKMTKTNIQKIPDAVQKSYGVSSFGINDGCGTW